MRVLIAAGGTGGHIYPGIAVANEIISRDTVNVIVFVGSRRGLEGRIVPDAGFDLEFIESAALKSVGVAGVVKSLLILPKSFFQARKIIRKFDPDVVVGVGGYVSGPVVLMASLMRIPTLVMDPNALPGFTNRRLAPFVKKAALTFEEALPYFGRKGVVTGNPVRRDFFKVQPRERDGGPMNLLIFGGSQGARGINLAMLRALPRLMDKKSDIRITHQTGKFDLETVKRGYEENGWYDAEVKEYISDMVTQFGKTDLIISRAGATTCAELAAAGKAAIMVPLPTAADDHQRKNAEAMMKAGAARMILQAELGGDVLADEIKRLLASPETLLRMEAAARKLSKKDAARATVDLIGELASGGGK